MKWGFCVAAVCVTAGCGRIGFEGGGDGGPPGTGDGRIGDGSSGNDDGSMASSPVHQVTNAPGRSDHPALVATTSGLAIAWQDDRDGNTEIYLALLAADGSPVTTDIRISNDAGASLQPEVAFTGSELGVVWQDDRTGTTQVWFQRVDPSGNLIAGNTQLTTDPAGVATPVIVWTGAEYGLIRDSQQGTTDDVIFHRISALGAPLGTATVQSTNSNANAGDLVWTGTEYGVTWTDDRGGAAEVYFVRLNSAGIRIGTEQPIGASVGGTQTLAWSGTGYAIAWCDASQRVLMNRVDAAGNPVGASTSVSMMAGTASNPSITGNGAEWAVSWSGNVATGDVGAFVARFDSVGTVVAQPIRVSPDIPSTVSISRVLRTATRYVIAFDEFDSDSMEIFVTMLVP